MDQKKWLIYRHVNKVNGKSYVGQTFNTIEQRWHGHVVASKRSDIPFHQAIAKYGNEQWDHEILEDNIPDQETANTRERHWICEYKSLLTENGYNCWGGYSQFQPSESTRKKMSDAQKIAQNDPIVRMKAAQTRKANGFTHSEDARRRIGKKNRGQKRSDEFCKRISEINKEVQNRPEVKQNRCEKAKMSWNDPEIRRRRCEAMKAGWAKKRLAKLESEDDGLQTV